ncbi:MAG: hypothetical protein KGS73_05210 [Chloroflexi bacterium]|nr:hypothetical protein [Chloroflexota bacterium]
MRFNSFKQKLQAGQPAIGVFSAVRSSLAAAMLARSGCDYVVLDSQHGEWEDASRAEAIRAVYLQQVVPVVRVRANDYGLIGRALDSGALGVVIPMVNSAAEARTAAEAMRYPPQGGRSGADNLSAHLGNDYHTWANQELFLAVQIETAAAVANAEAILAVEGVDGCLVGPFDLALSLGVAAGSPAHTAAIRQVLQACHTTGKVPGLFAGTTTLARFWIDEGYRFVTVSADTHLIEQGMRQIVEEISQGR